MEFVRIKPSQIKKERILTYSAEDLAKFLDIGKITGVHLNLGETEITITTEG